MKVEEEVPAMVEMAGMEVETAVQVEKLMAMQLPIPPYNRALEAVAVPWITPNG